MSIADVAKAYPTVQRLPKPETYEIDGRKYFCHMELSDVMVADRQFHAKFLTDDSGALIAVKLDKNYDTRGAVESTFKVIKSLLTQKYFPPSSEERENLGEASDGATNFIYKATWRSANTEILLRYGSVRSSRSHGVVLIYQKPAAAENL